MNGPFAKCTIAALAVTGLSSFAFHQSAPASFRNIQLTKTVGREFPPCEPSVAVSRRNPANIVAGSVLDRVMATSDGGETWSDGRLKSKYPVDGDPTIVSDAQGRFYYFHLANEGGGWPTRIICQTSSDGGRTWSEGTTVGHNPPTHQDKQWATTHPTKPYVYATWTQFDDYGSKDPLCHSIILFSMSRDAGVTWSKPVKISDIPGDCIDSDGTTEGAVPAVGADGKIYVTWSIDNTIVFNRSDDGGKTWLKHNIPIQRQYGGWDMRIPGTDRSNGMPVLAIDNRRKALYLTWADQRRGENDTDIFFSRSTDGGETWTEPLRVNQDGRGKQQFLPWLAVDPKTGNAYIVYYDRRAYDDLRTDVYVASSDDGGRTFHEKKISESPFVPTDKRFFGDYNNISAQNGVIVPIWTRMDEGKTSVWTAVIKEADLLR